jgi:hypothetical protein
MAKAIAVATKTTGTKGTKATLAPELIENLAKRWKAGEEMKTLAGEVKVTWPTLAGIFIAAGYRAKDRKKVKKTKPAKAKTVLKEVLDGNDIKVVRVKAKAKKPAKAGKKSGKK